MRHMERGELEGTNWPISLSEYKYKSPSLLPSCSFFLSEKMVSSKNNVSPMVLFLLGAASATVLLLFFLTARPGWPSLETTSQRSSVVCAPRVNRTFGEHHTKARIRAPSNEQTYIDEEFAEMLRKAAMDDNTIIMTSVNEAWAAPGSLLDSFLESFRVGQNVSHFVKHIIVVAMDKKAFARCKTVHPYCYFLRQEGLDLSAEKSYMTKDYLDLVWSKIKLQQRVLELGYNLLFTDVDLAWFRNPFEHITLAAHISTSSDFYFGNPDDLGNYPNTGFIYFKSCKKNIRVMDYWHKSRKRFPKNHDQFVFNEIKHEIVSKFDVRIKFLDSAHISGFCQLGRDLNKIATVHMTCCIGLSNKLHDLQNVIKDWKNYMSHPLWERQLGKIGWTFEGGKCIH